MTALTVYASSAASSVSTANKLYSVAGTPSTTLATDLVGAATGYGELYSQGNTSAWAAAGSDGTPTGHGFLWDVTTLEGNTFAAGTWSCTLRLSHSNPASTVVADFIARGYKRSSSGVYTQIFRAVLTAQNITTSGTNIVVSATTSSGTDFATGDKFYLDIWLNITTNPMSGSQTINLNHLSSDTVGLTGSVDSQYVTPGYAATGVTTTTYSFVEALVVSDIQSALFSWPVDALTTTESTLFADTDVPVEALSAVDVLLATDTDLPIDANTVSDSGGNLQQWPVDALTVTDLALFTDANIPVESLQALDVFLQTDTELALDALVVSDLGGNLQLWPVDALTATDSLLGVDVAVPVEAMSGVEVDLNTDVYGSIEALSVADSSTMVQSPLLTTTTYPFTDALVVVDSFLCVDGSLYTESTSASDSFAASDSYVPTEVQSVVDGLLSTDGAGWVELLSVGDASTMVSAASALLLFLSATAVTRDMQATAKTRDMQAIALTRDENIRALTRDEKATATTRDEQATAKTRG